MNSDYVTLLGKALKLLSIRPRSKSEITNYLSKKTSNPGLINQILDKLTKSKLIDDEEFARWVIESRSRSRPRGSLLLKRELKSKGIDSPVISIDEKALAAKALQKKLPAWKKLSYRDFRIKANRFLASRGFPWSVIEDAVKKAYNQPDVN